MGSIPSKSGLESGHGAYSQRRLHVLGSMLAVFLDLVQALLECDMYLVVATQLHGRQACRVATVALDLNAVDAV